MKVSQKLPTGVNRTLLALPSMGALQLGCGDWIMYLDNLL